MQTNREIIVSYAVYGIQRETIAIPEGTWTTHCDHRYQLTKLLLQQCGAQLILCHLQARKYRGIDANFQRSRHRDDTTGKADATASRPMAKVQAGTGHGTLPAEHQLPVM